MINRHSHTTRESLDRPLGQFRRDHFGGLVEGGLLADVLHAE